MQKFHVGNSFRDIYEILNNMKHIICTAGTDLCFVHLFNLVIVDQSASLLFLLHTLLKLNYATVSHTQKIRA